jgi:hypothetical protein
MDNFAECECPQCIFNLLQHYCAILHVCEMLDPRSEEFLHAHDLELSQLSQAKSSVLHQASKCCQTPYSIDLHSQQADQVVLISLQSDHPPEGACLKYQLYALNQDHSHHSLALLVLTEPRPETFTQQDSFELPNQLFLLCLVSNQGA